MHLLVTRPTHQAQKTIQALKALGHTCIEQPLLTVEPVQSRAPEGPFKAAILTSANAIPALQKLWADTPAALYPILATGRETRRAAAAAGFANVHSADGSARNLVTQYPTFAEEFGLATSDPVLYPCAENTAHDLPALLHNQARCLPWPVYRAEEVDGFTEQVRQQLISGRIEAVLLYSRRTADNFVRLMNQTAISTGQIRTFVLSYDIFCALPAAMRDKSQYPERPEEQLLFDLLDT